MCPAEDGRFNMEPAMTSIRITTCSVIANTLEPHKELFRKRLNAPTHALDSLEDTLKLVKNLRNATPKMNISRGDSSSPEAIEEVSSPTIEESTTTRSSRPPRRRSRSYSWSSETDMTKKNRKLINSHLRRMGDVVGKEASLNKNGSCLLRFRRFVVTIEVPNDHSGDFHVHTMIYRIEKGDDRYALIKKCMELNYNAEGTRGGTLGLLDDEINLFFSSPVAGLTRERLAHCLEDFMQTILDVNEVIVGCASKR